MVESGLASGIFVVYERVGYGGGEGGKDWRWWTGFSRDKMLVRNGSADNEWVCWKSIATFLLKEAQGGMGRLRDHEEMGNEQNSLI